MRYLITEMWMYLAAAFAVGAVTLWMLSRIHTRSLIARSDENWGTRLRAAEDSANTRLSAVEQSYTAQLEQREAELNALTTDLQSQRARATSLTDEVSKWRSDCAELSDKNETTTARLRILDERLAVALEDADQLDLERKRLRVELERRGSELTRAMSQVSLVPELERRIQETEKILASTEQIVAERETRIRGLEPLQDELREANEQIALLQRQHAADIARRNEEATRLRSRVGELEPMAARVDVLGGQLADKTAALTSLESQLAALNGFPGRLRESESELAQARERARQLEADLALLRGEVERLKRQPRRIDKDDLKRISGIGPKLESKLFDLGYRTYQQIAGWSDEDINRVERHLGDFPDRIRRDDWIGQAQKLHAENGADIIV